LEYQLITRYFPELDPVAVRQIEQLKGLYELWNSKINVISRKDLPNLYLNHVLHSLSLAMIIPFLDGETVLDIGTGGGFPGIPLAIMFPEAQFTLIDGTGKKIKVVNSIVDELGLKNVRAFHIRAEELHGKFHYILSRAVATFPRLVELSAGKVPDAGSASGCHGIYALKGGDFLDEIGPWKGEVAIFDIDAFFEEEFFKSKKIIFMPARSKSLQ
jgi:16S rRNA (guanine527-N7)-methyltransferase